ncbi:MAG: arginine--tRNA ligase [Candidatus Methanofastidiosia archaeon]
MMKKYLKDYLKKITGRDDIVIEMPPNPNMGDYSSAVAFQIAKEKSDNPVNIAKGIVAECNKCLPETIDKITTMGPYINFFVNTEIYARSVLQMIFEQDESYGTLESKNQRVIVEHTSVNPNKPLHMGAARNSILGDCIARVLRAAGYEVEVENYIDDLGIQFAEVFWGIIKEGDNANEKYDHFLGKLYIRVHEQMNPEIEEDIKKLNKELEDPSSENAKLARSVVERCVASHLESLNALNIGYDVLVWESDIVHAGLFDETFRRLRKSKDIVLEKDGPLEGCLVMKLGRIFPNMKNPDKVLIRSDGTPTYTAKDIALQMWKFGLLDKDLKYRKWDENTMTSSLDGEAFDFGNADIVINVIGSEQSYPQEVVKLSLKLLGYDQQSENSFHMAYEFVTLPNDSFSGRRGTWIGYTLDDVINAGREKAIDELDRRRPELSDIMKHKIGNALAIGSIRYNIVRYAPEKKIVFRWEDALNFEGDSCPYIEYAHARCCSILKRAKGKGTPSYRYEHQKERELIKTLSQLSGVVELAARDKRSHYITKYANETAIAFNSFYNELPVLKSEQINDRLALVDATRIVLANCMRLIGIEPLEEM